MRFFIAVVICMSVIRIAMDITRAIDPDDPIERVLGWSAVSVNAGILLWGVVLLWSIKS